MSMLMGFFKGENETDWDVHARKMHMLVKGDEQQKIIGGIAITLDALASLDEPQSNAPNKGYTHHKAVYHNPKSIHLDLDTFEYGQMPISRHVLPLADFIAVVGKLEGIKAGFMMDFYDRSIKPTQTLAFADEAIPIPFLEKASQEIFNFKNFEQKSAYSRSPIVTRGPINLERFGLEGTLDSASILGELSFGGTKLVGAYHTNLMKAFVRKYERLPGFIPSDYIVGSYSIQLNPAIGQPGWKEHSFQNAMDMIHKILEEKAARHVAA